MSTPLATSAGVFNCNFSQFAQVVEEKSDTCMDTSEIVVAYLNKNEDPFGRMHWIDHMGVDSGQASDLPDAFYDFWHGQDPIDPTKKRSQTHLPPVYKPSKIKDIKTDQEFPYTLAIMEKPLGMGYFNTDSDALKNVMNRETSGCWLVMRRGVVAREQSPTQQMAYIRELNEKTGSNYEEYPALIDLATVVFVRHAYKGECNLGGWHGAERQWTTSGCIEKDKKGSHLSLGGFNGFRVGALEINDYDSLLMTEDFGVALVQKFYH